MLSLLQGTLFLLLVVEEPTSSESLKSEDTGSVLKTIEDFRNEFMLFFESGNDFMDVFVPPDCIKDNIAQFKAFLDTQAKRVTLWTDGKMHLRHCWDEVCFAFRKSFFQIVYFICAQYDIGNVAYSLYAHYFMSSFVVAEYTKQPPEEYRQFLNIPYLPPYPRASGRYVMSYENGSLFLTSEFEKKLIDHQTPASGLFLEQQRMLNGSFIHLKCVNTYACQHPSFNVTLMLLTHLNASVSVDHAISTEEMFSSTIINSLDNLAHGHKDNLFDALHHFESAGFSFYVRKRDPFPREAIFILPFCWKVWVALFASCLLLFLTHVVISKAMLKEKVNIFNFIFPMVAAFFQQSAQLHRSLLSASLSRLLYGIMALMFVVISTAFKGRLTALLNDLPLKGEATQFVSFEHLVGTGHRLCFLEGQSILGPFAPLSSLKIKGPIHTKHHCYRTSNTALRTPRSINFSSDGRDTFFTYNSRTGPSEALRRELLGRGYVETEGIVFSYPVGPEMMSSSVYRHHFSATLSRAIEAGLYKRYAALAEYKSRYFHEGSLQHGQELVLTFSDLRPFFMAWLLGVSFSVLLLIGETTLFCMKHQNFSDIARIILNHPLKHRIHIIRLKKRNRGRVFTRDRR